jgi:trigger factor
MRMFRGTFEPVEDGEVERDDLLYASMKMIVDGETIASEDNFDLAARDIRIKGVPLKGLGDALEGKEVGDTVSFKAPVPEDHDNADLRGKTASFEFKISEIKRLALPEIDEAFLESMGAKNEKELREELKSGLEREVEHVVKRRMKEQVGDYLIEKTKIEIPTGLSHRQTERSLARRMIEMYQSGYPQAEIEKQMDELRGTAHDQTVRDLKLYFILDKIGEEREVDVTEEEMNGAIAQIAQRGGKRFDRVRDELAKGDGLTTLYMRVRDDKILESLLADAEVKDVEGPPKKKASAKKTKKETESKPKAEGSSKTKGKTKSKKKEE